MDQLILQVGDRSGRSAELVRSQGDTFSVGRNYDNELVIMDPYVDPEQLIFFRSSHGWKVRQIDNTNPALINGDPIGVDGVAVNSSDRITIGRTRLRVCGGDHAVEPTRKLLLSSWFGHGQSHPFFALLMLIFACAISLVVDYLELTAEIKWKEMLTSSLQLGLVILFWASAWALAGRLLRHQPNFTAQLGFTALITGLLGILSPLGGYVEYASNSAMFGEIAQWLIALVILTALFRANLSFATNLKHYTATAFIGAAALMLTIYAMEEFSKEEFSYEPEYSTALKPPFARLSGSRSMQEYGNAFSNAFDQADTLARKD